ncbi:MAG: translation initiation factor IF-2 [Candidatus Woesearchaeota archaeon]
MERIRSPICTVVGHVDHGKSSILDKIRGTAIVSQEAGGITQAIGASIIPISTIKKVCGKLLEALKLEFTIPGLLFIDTPGHAAFTNLRKRGGNLADIAILVVDINEGFKPQTNESVEILKSYKTPFVVAANKIDLIEGWRVNISSPIVQNIQNQNPNVITDFETKLYKIASSLSEFGFSSERFDRVDDYTKQVAIIPCSAKTGEGVAELLMVVAGLAQKYLEKKLMFGSDYAKGTILEVKEEKGLGKVMDVIIYDGCLKVGDTIVIGGLNSPVVSKVRALLQPEPLAEIRSEKAKFHSVREVCAATGVRISAPGMENVVSGMPIVSCEKGNVEGAKKEVQGAVEEVTLAVEQKGVVVKADSLGSLEAIMKLLREKNISVMKASIGNITKKDISDAESNIEKNPLYAAILGFNVDIEGQTSGRAKIITSKIIYQLIEEFEQWQEQERKKMEAERLSQLVRPCKIQILEGYVFRQSNPAIVGCEILEGVARTGMPIMKGGKQITSIKEIQLERENITSAERGLRVAISFENVTVGRQIKEGDILYSAVPEEHFKEMKKLKEYLRPDELALLKEIADIMRKENPVWGV